MKYLELPQVLMKGDKVACPRCGPDSEVLEVARVRDDGRLLLVRASGVAVRDPLDAALLRAYDYKLVVPAAAPAPEVEKAG